MLLLLPMWGCDEDVRRPTRTFRPDVFASLSTTEHVRPTRPVEVLPPPPPPSASTYGMDPTSCERFLVRVDDDGQRRYRRIRKPWSKADERRFGKLINLVAKQMGAKPALFRAWAMRESTLRPSAIHVLNPDIEAATIAWHRFNYDPSMELELEQDIAELDPTQRDYWTTKAKLSRVRTFRENAYLGDLIEYELHLPNGVESKDVESIWAFGYGPFGFNPAYFLPVWDATSPPWVFCGDDGLAAIVTAVWAAREHQRECEQLGVGDSYAIVNRRFGKGHCADPGPAPRFAKRARRYGIDPHARAQLGKKWPRHTTDRAELLAHLRAEARTAGLLNSSPTP